MSDWAPPNGMMIELADVQDVARKWANDDERSFLAAVYLLSAAMIFPHATVLSTFTGIQRQKCVAWGTHARRLGIIANGAVRYERWDDNDNEPGTGFVQFGLDAMTLAGEFYIAARTAAGEPMYAIAPGRT